MNSWDVQSKDSWIANDYSNDYMIYYDTNARRYLCQGGAGLFHGPAALMLPNASYQSLPRDHRIRTVTSWGRTELKILKCRTTLRSAPRYQHLGSASEL